MECLYLINSRKEEMYFAQIEENTRFHFLVSHTQSLNDLIESNIPYTGKASTGRKTTIWLTPLGKSFTSPDSSN